MTPDEKHRHLEFHAKTLQHIGELKKSAAFNEYFMVRLTSKQKDAMSRFMHDPPDKCDALEREILRRVILAYEELGAMPAQDEANSRRALGG